MANLTPKYLRAHAIDSTTPTQSLVWFMKVLYEFWGYCYNTPESHDIGALGFPVGGIDMPAGFESGSLLHTGSSGYTVLGESIFRDDIADFTSGSLAGKHLVTWKSGSTINDDGIYKIKRIFGSSSMLVDTNHGATPYTGSLTPLFTDRSSILYRIVDFNDTATNISMLSGSSLVLEISGASTVNSGQIDPHFRVKFTEDAGDNIEISWSPSGSWNGSGFGSDEVVANDRDWSDNVTTGEGFLTLICASDFMVTHWKGVWNDEGSGFHFEIPKRLYPQQNDPNPIAASIWGNDEISPDPASTNYGDAAWYMHTPPLDTIDIWKPLAIPYWGQTYATSLGGSGTALKTLIPGRRNGMGHNPITDKFYVSDVILSFINSTEFYSLSRVRMRRFRLTSNLTPDFSRLGTNGEWIKLNDGILWPWDNAILPYGLLLSGQ